MRSGLVSREFLRIAGGYGAASLGTSPAGGLDIDNAGNFATDGDVSIKGVLSAGSTPLVLTNAAGLIDGGKIQDGTIDTVELADDAVTAAKLDATADFIMNTLQLGANVVKNADGETVITLDANQNVSLESDLYFKGGGSIGTDTDTDLLEIADDTVTVNGNTGFGISTPSALMHGQGTLAAGPTYQLILNGDDLGTDGEGCAIFLGATSLTGRGTFLSGERINSSNAHGLAFGVSANSSAPAEGMRLTSTGLGINDTTPSYQLDVNGTGRFVGDFRLDADATFGNASTDTLTHNGRTVLRSVSDAGPMTATAGTQCEIVFNTSDSKFYGCTVSGSPATWAALN
jgi:hypothetical protein